MKCRFFLFFVSLLFLATPQEKLHAPNTAITSINVDPGITQEQLDAMGTTARDARITTAKTVANRALAGTDIVTAADAPTLAKGFYDAEQAQIAGQQTTIDNLQSEDKKDDQTINGLAGGLAATAVAVGGGVAAAWAWNHRRRNKATRKNALRKLKSARQMIEEMADDHVANPTDQRKATKLRDSMSTFMREKQRAVSEAVERTKRHPDTAQQHRFLEQVHEDHEQYTRSEDRIFTDAYNRLDPQFVESPAYGHVPPATIAEVPAPVPVHPFGLPHAQGHPGYQRRYRPGTFGVRYPPRGP